MSSEASSIHEIYDHAGKMLENGKDKDAILEYLVSNDIYHTIAGEIYDEILLKKLGIKRSASNTFFAWALMVVSLFVALSSLFSVGACLFRIVKLETPVFLYFIIFVILFLTSIASLYLVNSIYNGKLNKYWSLLFLTPLFPISIMVLVKIYERIKSII
jgi:hypothetical protein